MMNDVDDYILKFSPDIREKLNTMRALIRKFAPEATERISYGMPAYFIAKKPLVYFGGFTKHLGFYATPTSHSRFKDQLSGYKHGKGSVQFPYEQTLPTDLIADMIKFRLETLNKV